MINLSKGQKIDLTKNADIKRIRVGLGWDEAVSGVDIDCDASCLLLNSNEKLAYNNDKDAIIYFGSLKHHGLEHSGDNLTGEGEGDDENIFINLDKVPTEVEKVLVIMNIYKASERRQSLGMLKNAYINVYDDKNNSQLCHFALDEDYGKCQGLIVGEVYRHNNEWKFSAIGEAVKDASFIKDISSRYE